MDLRNFLLELKLAAATLTLWPILDERAVGTAQDRARALVFTPIFGLIAGLILSLLDRALMPLFGSPLRSFILVMVPAFAMLFLPWRGLADIVAALRAGIRPASTGLARIGPLGALAAVAGIILEVLLLAAIDNPAARTAALVMTSTLGRWSIVPVAYGLKAGERWGLGLPFEGGIEFREFAASSVLALGVTLALFSSIGLIVIVALALLVLGLRFLFSRRFDGVPGFALAGASAIVELTVMATVATLTQ